MQKTQTRDQETTATIKKIKIVKGKLRNQRLRSSWGFFFTKKKDYLINRVSSLKP